VPALGVGNSLRGLVSGVGSCRLPAPGKRALRQKARGVGGEPGVARSGLHAFSKFSAHEDIRTHNMSLQPTPLRGAAELHRYASE
jgi:hypothetical protein